jgi:aminopeptidase N
LGKWTLCLFLLVLTGCDFFRSAVPTRQPGARLTQDYMELRQSHVSNVEYHLKFDLTQQDDFSGTSQIQFELDQPFYLTVDFSGGQVSHLRVNDQPVLPVDYNGYYIVIPEHLLREGANQIEVDFIQSYSNNGTGLYRYVDSQDQRTYLYSHFEPYWANKMFPCFDQPNLKATFISEVKAPSNWQVISSTPEAEVFTDSEYSVWSFNKSQRFSTYTFSLHAGDYHKWESTAQVKGREIPLRLFARQSMKNYVDPEEWFELTRKGFVFFEDYFSYPYPYIKYDQLIVPDFNSGAMENVGAVTFNEDRFVSRGPKSRDQQRRLALTLLHEMAHMWFGNLVTMNWWDELWLNESFASHLAYVALAHVTDFKESWMVFNSNMKSLAYRLDLSSNTHPVMSSVSDTQEATAQFDMITYGKGASILRQLSFYLGEQPYRKALALYFKKFAHSNTQLRDFMEVMEEVSGLDLKTWEERWFRTPMLNDVEVHFTCQKNKINLFEIYQTGTKDYPTLRTHKTQVALFYKDKGAYRLWKRQNVLIQGEHTDVKSFIGQPCPQIVYPNFEDHGYLRIVLDKTSLKNIKENLVSLNDSFTRGLIWSDLWQMLLDRNLDLDTYLEIVEFNGLNESHPHNLKRILTDVSEVLGRFYPKESRHWQQQRMVWVQFFEQSYLARLRQHFDDPMLQNIWFEALVKMSESPSTLEKLARLLNGRETLDLSFPLNQDQRWDILAQLMLHNYSKARDLVELETQRDQSQRGQLRSLYLSALLPDSGNKRHFFDKILAQQQGMSLAETRSVMAGLFPSQQEALHMEFANEIFSGLKQVYKKSEPIVSVSFANYLVPIFCDQNSSSRINDFIAAEKGQIPFSLLKSLRQSLFENDRCREMRQMLKEKNPSHSDLQSF